MFLKSLLEITMLVCFGAAWPISIYKSWTSHSSKGKSVVFLAVIVVGYAAGIGKCLLTGAHCTDMMLYFRNIAMERSAAAA